MTANPRNEVESILNASQQPAAKRLLAGSPAPFSSSEVAAVEQLILNNASRGASLKNLLAAMDAMLAKVCPDQAQRRMRKVSFTYPTSSNPFADGVRKCDSIYIEGSKWFADRHGDWKSNAVSFTGTGGAADLFKLFLVSSIFEFEILDIDYIPAMIASLKVGQGKEPKRRVSLHRTMVAVPLSLPWGSGEQAEERLYVAGGGAVVLLNDFFDHSKSMKLLNRLSFGGNGSRANDVLAELDQECSQRFRSPSSITIPKLIEAARQVAILQLPPAVVAHRSREFVSHNLRIDVLNRLGNYDIAPFPEARLRKAAARTEADAEDQEPDGPQSGPVWMTALRQAVKRDQIDRRALQELAKGDDIRGRCMGEYALWLSRSSKPSSIHRYVFLIASRLMPRFESGDPAEVDEDTWEEVIEQVLDEDEFFRQSDVSGLGVRRRRGHSQPLLRAMHSFLRFLRRGNEEYSELHKKLPAAGLMQVEANFVTVDEYKAALQWLGGIEVYPDLHMIEASRVALILGYRCGLRRAESAYLRLGDFDEADHLHVRPWRMRKLKTSNARRDLPLAVLLPADELEQVKRLIGKVHKLALDRERVGGEGNPSGQDRTWRDALLFRARKDPFRADDFEAIIARVHQALRVPKKEFPGDKDFHYHILRHSFANMVLLKLWPALHPVARRILHRHKETLDWIAGCEQFRERLFGTTRIRGKDLQAIALLMGHGASATTLEHYLHVLDWYRIGGAGKPRGERCF